MIFSLTVGQQLSDPSATLSDHLLAAVLNLLKKEVSEHGRHLTQYFHLFLMYANLGIAEVLIQILSKLNFYCVGKLICKIVVSCHVTPMLSLKSCAFFQKQQLLKLNVPATFMLVALDEGPGPPIKYQYAELGKLYSVVSQLVRCCDVSSRCQSSSHVGVISMYCFFSL